MYRWYDRKLAEKTNYLGSLDKPYIIKEKIINAPDHPRIPDTSLKLDAIKCCFSIGEGVEYVSRDIGYSRVSIYSWYRKYKKFGVAGLMSSKKQIKRENIDFNVGTGTVGSVYKFGDLEVASEISILDDLNSVIASISYERKTVSDDMDEAQEADIKDVAE